MYRSDCRYNESKDFLRFQPREDLLNLSYLPPLELRLDAWLLSCVLELAIVLRCRRQQPKSMDSIDIFSKNVNIGL